MANAIIKKLQRQKERFQKSVVEFEEWLENVPEEPTKTQVSGMEVYLQNIRPMLSEFSRISDELADENIDITTEETEFRRKYMKVLVIAETKAKCAREDCIPQSTSTLSANVKLPAIEIPTFTGKYEDWPTFCDMFTSLIHTNGTLTDIQKFHYLQSALKGEAAQTIKCLKLSEIGYELAWDRLKTRYQNERLIVKNHVKALLHLQPIKRDSYASLRQFIDTIAVNLAALKSIKRPVHTYNDFLIEHIAERLDTNLRKEWEGKTCNNPPTYEQLETFLTEKCKQLEAVSDKVLTTGETSAPNKSKVLHMKTAERKCVMCNEEHNIYKCERFQALSVADRITAAKEKKMCYNCLGKNHSVAQCKSSHCRKCDKKHHTLLHIQPEETSSTNNVISENSETPVAVNFTYTPSQVLLSTCKVLIKDKFGKEQEVRALLDSGSQPNLMTESCAKRLGLTRKPINAPIVTAGANTRQINQCISAKVYSRVTPYTLSLNALLIDKITELVPTRVVKFDESKIPTGIQLADPEFCEPQYIDLLIRNDHYHDILCDGRIESKSVSLFNTHFGWILRGQLPFKSECKPMNSESSIVSLVGVNELLMKFWEIESYKGESFTPVDERCERHFVQNTVRDAEGRFQVALPFKDDPARLGNSSESAKRRFLSLERRLLKAPEIYDEYRKFMSEYKSLGHMHETTGDVNQGYYLPHHCVVKQSSLTTKLRVVFNGSAPTSSGISLNEILMVGPPVQSDLFTIMVRMRCWQYVITADVVKMYRQVKVRPEDRIYQRVWWRNSPADKLTSYELSTVTYGTASAAYLAIRSLRELALRESSKYPIGSQRCLNDFYVDDLITGADTVNELIQVRDEVNGLLESGCFQLKRWASNNQCVFKSFKTDSDDDVTILTRGCESDTTNITTLGTIWNPAQDILSYKCCVLSSNASTKRSVLSELSRIYDPLGLIGPIIIVGKVFIQRLWKLQCGWDDPLPEDNVEQWRHYANNLKSVPDISVPRQVIENGVQLEFEVHGFADASEYAYGACIYVVTIQNKNRISSNLLCAKSRVAPVKAISIPRLELCAAVLLAELFNRASEAIKHIKHKRFFYSDSMIALSWIKSESRKFKTFVCNRVGAIHNLTKPDEWRHVSTKENPADLILRGTTTADLQTNKLWWRGPDFLLNLPQVDNFIPHETLPEVKCTVALISIDNITIPDCSTYEKSVRVMAYVLRVKDRLKKNVKDNSSMLTINELHRATIVLLRQLQYTEFSSEISLLKRGLCIKNSSKLITLNPFLDGDGLIRVGGRLANSEMSNQRKFPIVLPSSHKLTKLIVNSVHRANMHIGAQGTLAATRLKFWPLCGKSLTRSVVRGCVRSIRAKPHFQEPLMGALPPYRTQQFRPFLRAGVDYCGPFTIKEGSRRSKKTSKAYVCIFICCATKAVHVELVSNLTTECFMAAFYRFISRRGCVSEIISDNATNFIGARNHLRELGSFLLNPENEATIQADMVHHGIKWTFIPPRAPHFGGLWEAAVKSVKGHLHRVAGKAILTAEELSTLLTQIEAVLNSRPLCPLSDDPNDFSALTPSHFLIGDVLTAPVDPDYLDTPDNRLSRWQLIEKMRQDVWKRWKNEYLTGLHQRGKWRKNCPMPKVGDLIIVKEDNIPPLQ